MTKRISVETMRRSLKRANVSFLLYIIVLFQLSAMVLLSLKDGAIDMQAIDRIFRQWGIIGKDWDAIAERDQRRIRQRREKAREKSQDT